MKEEKKEHEMQKKMSANSLNKNNFTNLNNINSIIVEEQSEIKEAGGNSGKNKDQENMRKTSDTNLKHSNTTNTEMLKKLKNLEKNEKQKFNEKNLEEKEDSNKPVIILHNEDENNYNLDKKENIEKDKILDQEKQIKHSYSNSLEGIVKIKRISEKDLYNPLAYQNKDSININSIPNPNNQNFSLLSNPSLFLSNSNLDINTKLSNSTKTIPVISPVGKKVDDVLTISSIRKIFADDDKKDLISGQNKINIIPHLSNISNISSISNIINQPEIESPTQNNFNNNFNTISNKDSSTPDYSFSISKIPQNFEIDPQVIMSKDFNIHEFDSQVGRANVLPIIGKTIFKTLELMDLINTDKLDNFLYKISSGYFDKVQYHNSVHAADVAQSIATYYLNSNLEEITLINNNDILAIITAALGHDIGHPGTNNGFQMNTYSDIAITYNDQSVLENFHCSTFFKISRALNSNVFEKIPENEYRQIRKRIVCLILATDMIQHAKVLSMIKPKVIAYKDDVSKAKLNDPDVVVPFISSESNIIFDEQQKIMDFIIHTADLSHNSKKFKISNRWTDLLMDEFWQQGDTERTLGLPISFLCDRYTADVPKSQIGFIRGIVSPTFEVLIELCPGLNYLKEDIDNNLEEWNKIVEDKRMTTPGGMNKSPRIGKSPMMGKSPRFSTMKSPNVQGTTFSTMNRLSLNTLGVLSGKKVNSVVDNSVKNNVEELKVISLDVTNKRSNKNVTSNSQKLEASPFEKN
jgi:hypothetical protein